MFRRLLILLALSLLGAFIAPMRLTAQESETTSTQPSPLSVWESVSVGSVIYAEVVEPPDAIYRDPYGTTPDGWIRENNTKLFGEAINVSERHTYLDRNHVVRVRVMDGGWGEILPDGLHSPYIPEPTQFHPTYISLQYLTPIPESEFAPISVHEDTQPVDKLVVIIADAHPRLIAYEGEEIVLHIPVVLGPTPHGDFRVYRTRVTDDMPGIPGVPFSNYFSGGNSIHGAPWWNWRETVRGHYGSHGCVNLPDNEWYHIRLDGEYKSIERWVYRWFSTNINYDETNPDAHEARVGAENPGWYQATGSVRVLVVDQISDLGNFPLTRNLGPEAASAQVTSWQPLIDNYNAIDNQWLLMHETEDGFQRELITSTQSIAQIEGDTDSDQWILLECSDSSLRGNTVYPGSSRTVGELCDHLRVERGNSICTPERVDIDFFGQRVLCNADRFNLLHIRERGELIEHERIHMIQFAGYFKDLHLMGVPIDDATYFEHSYTQISSIGVTELMAQSHNIGSQYAEDYVFMLARPDGFGGVVLVNGAATTQEAWNHLHRECGDPTLQDPELRDLLTRGLMGEADAYQELERICSMPPHRLVPDRYRIVS